MILRVDTTCNTISISNITEEDLKKQPNIVFVNWGLPELIKDPEFLEEFSKDFIGDVYIIVHQRITKEAGQPCIYFNTTTSKEALTDITPRTHKNTDFKILHTREVDTK